MPTLSWFGVSAIKSKHADGKLCLDVGWSSDSTFADVIGAVVLYIDTKAMQIASADAP